MYLNFDLYRGSKPAPLPAVVFNLLNSTEKNYFPSNQNQAISRWAAISSGSTSTKIEFSHSLVRSAENEWDIIENSTRGEGGFGAVRPAKLKIVIDKNKKKAEVFPTEDVVKIQTLPYDPAEKLKKIQATHKEADHQRNHYVNVKKVVVDGPEIFIVTEDCGTSLDQLSFLNKPFDYCLQVALGILNEMMILEQKGVVHRDLKPQNICLKYLNNSSEFKIILIDFGLADDLCGEKNKERSGTAFYMAPELFERHGKTSVASDIYALAGILGYVFGTSNVLKQKIRQNSPLAPFYFDDLGQKLIIPPDLESASLFEDIKEILHNMQGKNPSRRPDLNFINRFFIAIPQRRELYKQHLAAMNTLDQSLKSLESEYTHLGLLNSLNNGKNRCCLSFFKTQAKSLFHTTFIQKRAAILEAIKTLPETKSHYQITHSLFLQEKSNSDYSTYNPFPSLDSIRNAIQKQAETLEKFRQTFIQTDEKISGDLFDGTNSSGILEIRKILRTKLSLFDKVTQLQKIGREKTQKFGFSYWYSHSSIFGKGRHANIEQLYQKLAALDRKVSQQDGLNTLDEINQFINPDRSFTYS